MNVLITGGGGFIGSHLVESQLTQGNHVRTVDLQLGRLSHLAGKERLELVQGDISDERLVRDLVVDVGVVFHLASAHLDVSRPSEHYHHVNVAGTAGLLQAARAASVTRFVHCSSVGVIGNVEEPPADEGSPCQPTNVYEKTKLEGETFAREFAKRTGFSVVIARPAWVYGPRCGRTRKLLRTVGKGRFVFFGNGRNLRHPVYISDAVAGLEACAQADVASGEVYIIAGERAVTIRELVEAVAEVQGVRPPWLRLPVLLGIVAGHTLQTGFGIAGKQPPFSRRSLDFFLKDNAYDISKAQKELGYCPQVDLHEGLEATLHAQATIVENETGDNANYG